MVTVDIITIAVGVDSDFMRTRVSVLQQRAMSLRHIIVVPQAYDVNNAASAIEAISATLPSPNFVVTQVLNQSGYGISNAFNTGLAASQGDLIIFMNSGDSFWNGDSCLLAVLSFSREKWPWAAGGTASVSGRGKILKVRLREDVLSIEDLAKSNCINHQSVFFSRQLIEKVGFYNEDLSMEMDYDYNLRCIMLFGSCFLLRSIIARYNVCGRSALKPFKHFNHYRSVRDSHLKLHFFERCFLDFNALCKAFLRLLIIPVKRGSIFP